VTTIYVDGYNVILRCSPFKELAATELESARDSFIDRLARYGASIQEQIIVVFDGKEEHAGLPGRTNETFLTVLFTTDAHTADLSIQRALMRVRNGAGDRIVVTGDGALAAAASALGAIAISPEMFMRQVAHAERETTETSSTPGRRPHHVRVEDIISSQSREGLLEIKTIQNGSAAEPTDMKKDSGSPDV